METDYFWTLIADCRRQGLSGDGRDTRLREALLRLPPPEVIRFQACLEYVTGEAYSWNLWAAADRIFGGWCSDDTFCWFQRWMVGLGRPVFEAAVADPDVLAYAPEVLRLSGRPREAWAAADRPQWESLAHLAPRAYERLTAPFTDFGDAFHAAARDLLEAELEAAGATGSVRRAAAPRGRRWSALDEAESRRRLPRLTAMFPLTPR
ncbi:MULTISPECIES: DUF4240 domain-containing protein [unclassified Streptomyces]|uniref:DUF4240 domain-containing protein n=1 Tax=unclassified Streptomyces TaxID=2593676 RepID=UPI002E2AE005|nr:DUF4240 domain-containing protein [Streptomyces sp. NBC_00223]